MTNSSLLLESIGKLEILSNLRGKNIQKLITQKQSTMPIIFDIRRDPRFQQGRREGKKLGRAEGKIQGRILGMQKAEKEMNTRFVINLLDHTGHSVEEIAKLANVSVDFVLSLQKKKQSE